MKRDPPPVAARPLRNPTTGIADIRAVLFDKDGTLIDFNATWLDFARELALEAADGDPQRAVELLEKVGLDRRSNRFLPGSIFAAGTNAEVIAALYPHLSAAALRVRIATADLRAAQIARRRAIALPGIVDALGRLFADDYLLGLATNDATNGAEQTLLSLGVADLFAAAYGYDAVARPKPAPDVVHAFADLIGLPPRMIAVIGDNVHDLQTARAAGAGLAIGVLTGTGKKEDLEPLSDILLASAAHLPGYLKRIRNP